MFIFVRVPGFVGAIRPKDRAPLDCSKTSGVIATSAAGIRSSGGDDARFAHLDLRNTLQKLQQIPLTVPNLSRHRGTGACWSSEKSAK